MKNHESDSKEISHLSHLRSILLIEQTFSAWIRTAFASIASGVGIIKLISFKTEFHEIVARILGEMLIVCGCLIIIIATMDYKKHREELKTIHCSKKSAQLYYRIIVLFLAIISILIIWVTLPNSILSRLYRSIF